MTNRLFQFSIKDHARWVVPAQLRLKGTSFNKLDDGQEGNAKSMLDKQMPLQVKALNCFAIKFGLA